MAGRGECVVCGNEYPDLDHHLAKAHELSSDEYSNFLLQQNSMNLSNGKLRNLIKSFIKAKRKGRVGTVGESGAATIEGKIVKPERNPDDIMRKWKRLSGSFESGKRGR